MKTIAHNLLLFAALALPALCAAQPKPTDDPQRNLQKFDNFYRYLNMTYVDTVHNGQLVENAIREVLCNWTLTRPTYRLRKWSR